ncbi:5-hydroxytryptamine receptor 3B-like [Eucyclogobius newberryi]|uniref:5-hydroxytryptamine receptor 3B-like n=1 Tax=Eucyclogobius newberryi TaxID=166745 RepID=UPI003B5C37D5
MSVVWLILLLALHRTVQDAECVPEKPKRSALNQLTRSLLRDYNNGVRPVHNWTSTTTVSIDLILQSVLDVDGKTQTVTTSLWYRQTWTDEFLVWDPDDFDGITEISLSSDAIWVPDVIVTEFVDDGKSPHIPYVYVDSSGLVKNYRPIQVVLACALDMYAFPFDKQNCSLTFRSWLHSVTEINLSWMRDAEAIAQDKRQFMNDGEWELLSIPSNYRHILYGDTEYAHIHFHVLIRRRPLLYVVSLLIPSLFLMLVDVISFYLPPDSGTRIAFKISILLGYTVFRVNLRDELPASALTTPLIGVYFVVCMAMLMLSLIKSIVVVKLLHYGEQEVRQTSVSARLLHMYGSHIRTETPEGALTSNTALQTEEPEDEYSLEEDLASLSSLQDAPSGLEWLLQELVSLRLGLSEEDREGSVQARWLSLCLKLDVFLFRVYLLVLGVYTGTLLLLWARWSNAG